MFNILPTYLRERPLFRHFFKLVFSAKAWPESCHKIKAKFVEAPSVGYNLPDRGRHKVFLGLKIA